MFADPVEQELFNEISQIPCLDCHTHIDPLRPTASTLDDLLGYHYFTELAHAVGMPAWLARVASQECTRAVLAHFRRFDNHVAAGWLIELLRLWFDWDGEDVSERDAEQLWALAETRLKRPDWAEHVWQRTRLRCLFLTNDFDDSLQGFDNARYVPCLRTDELVFRLEDRSVRERLYRASGVAVADLSTFRQAMHALCARFVERGAKACAVSLPPDFVPVQPENMGSLGTPGERLWLIAETCRTFQVPFDLMLGVYRRVYAHGVPQGMDLFDQRVSLYAYAPLFNAFPEVSFCVSILSSSLNQELTSYAWIFPNVYACGHWWYSNVPASIENDLRLRLQAAPRHKIIGYYSDAYKLEFILPKFNMYRRVLARVLAQDFVRGRHWTTSRTLALARDLLWNNPQRLFALDKCGTG